jgi:hypothetical protein
MSKVHRVIHSNAADFWMARGAVVVIALLQLLLVNDLSFGPRWLAPTLELVMLVPLSVATAWTQIQAGQEGEDHHWQLIGRNRRWIRLSAILLTALISIVNAANLFELVRRLLTGHGGAAATLLVDAVNIWTTNVIIFALWFWSTDRGGPPTCGLTKRSEADFLFPQMMLSSKEQEGWLPGFVDYLFLAFTNSTAFSPADTMPMSHRAKLLMMAEAMISLLTIAFVAARAVGILG